MSGFKRIDPQIKEQILSRIKNDGVIAAQAARDAGVSPKTVYGWLAGKAEAGDPVMEINRLKRELEQAHQVIGKFAVEMERTKKKGAV